MTPDQVQLVQQSFAKVVPISELAAVLFYDRLFEVAPSVKSLLAPRSRSILRTPRGPA